MTTPRSAARIAPSSGHGTTGAGRSSQRHDLILAGLPWVTWHARRLGCRGQDFDDAVQDGCLGLIAAVDRFDPSVGTSLSTFAWRWIEGAIRRGALGRLEFADAPDARAVRTPVDESARPRLIEPDDIVVRWRFGFVDGRPHSREEVARFLGWSPSRVREHERRALSQLRGRLAKIGLRAPDGADPL